MDSREEDERLLLDCTESEDKERHHVGSHVRALGCVLLACQGGFCAGLALGYASPAIPDMADTLLDNDTKTSWFAAIVTLGAACGCPLAAVSVGKIGRKGSLIATSLPFIAGNLLIAYSHNLMMLMAGRVLTGISVGASVTVVPIYVSEISPKTHRGMFGAFLQLSVTVAILVIFTLGMWLHWQWLAVVNAGFSAIWLITMTMIPETPRYLLSQGHVNMAKETLNWLRACDAEMEFLEMEEFNNANDDTVKWIEFTKPRLYRPLLLGIGLLSFQQLTGVNAVMSYLKTIFVQANIMTGHSDIPPILAAAAQVVATFGSVFLVDRLGRRVLLITGGAGQCIACVTFGLYFFLTERNHVDIAWVAIVSVCLFIIAFSVGWGPVTWIVMSEIFPIQARGLACGMCTVCNWTFAFLVTYTFPPLMHAITSYGVFWLYGGLCFLSVIFVAVFLFETKGKSLEAIEMHFSNQR